MNFKKFFGGQNKVQADNDGAQTVQIKVDHGYEPDTVSLKKGVPAKLVFHRLNESDCLAKVQSSELGFKKKLPLNRDVEVSINTDQSGEFDFACGMNMFHGKVVIR